MRIIVKEDSMKIKPNMKVVTGVQPGEVCEFKSGSRGPIEFRSLQGIATSPICIIGSDVQIDAEGEWCGLWLRDCQHVIVEGGARSIHIFNSSNVGLMAGYGSTFLSVQGIEVHDCSGAGIAMKTEVNDPQPDDFKQRNTTISGCYIHDVNAEGLYIGSSFYDAGAPHLDGVIIEGNVIASTGGDGLQVGSALRGILRGNIVLNAGLNKEQGQECGILLNHGTHALVTDNHVFNARNGIYTHGLGGMITHNTVMATDVGLFLAGPCKAHDNILIHCETPVQLAHEQAQAWNNCNFIREEALPILR